MKAYPLNGQCQIEVIYEGPPLINQPNYKEKKYFGIAEESLKGHLYYHNLSFRKEFYKSNKELPQQLLQFKMEN